MAHFVASTTSSPTGRATTSRHRVRLGRLTALVLISAFTLSLVTTSAGAVRATGVHAAAPSAATLGIGSSGPAVTSLQQRLIDLGFRPGDADGRIGAATASAVLAFQKRAGLARTAVANATTLAALQRPLAPGPLPGSVRPRIEVDVDRQILFVVLASGAVVTINASTGTGKQYRGPNGRIDVAYTPIGTFTVVRKISGVGGGACAARRSARSMTRCTSTKAGRSTDPRVSPRIPQVMGASG
jgi:peptidoglycan hydrolase-like protein with peptidoglycan-binding domain